ncbi:MAG: aminotransferase class V-fold PLP-dependent enzyme [Candidatus Kapabacteria bacterium]|nr:aminotransferase class V-fold PLP-dependent enzyme [Candidatus Kapabacteria bacterium]
MFTIENIRENIVGINQKVTLLDGREKQYVFFDNGASTPSFQYSLDKINEFMNWYSAVHRGSGIKSIVASQAYDDAHNIVGEFVGADPLTHTIIFLKNTTEAINKLSYRIELTEDEIVLISGMEHHSNLLPWRRSGKFDIIKIDKEGYLDYNDLDGKIRKYGKRIKLIAVTGASNGSGIVNDYHRIAEIAHSNGSMILVDAAQLSPHRKINMLKNDDPRHIDFLVMSAHKMYSPYGIGVLIMPNDICLKGDPEYVGGGNSLAVTHKKALWRSGADKEEAGSPNTVGGIAFAAALKVLLEIGMDKVAQHELELTEYILKKFAMMPSIKTLIKTDYDNLKNRLGVITFNIENINYQLVGAILCYEFGIGLRCGRFCTQPYINKLLGLTEEEDEIYYNNLANGERKDIPGVIRISFGIYNTIEEIDYLIQALEYIIEKKVFDNYYYNNSYGEYRPINYEIDSNLYFKI